MTTHDYDKLYYFVFLPLSRGKRVYYGPYDTEEAAARANFFRQTVDDLNTACPDRVKGFLLGDVNAMTQSEIEYVRDYHDELGWKSVEFRPPSKLRAHSSWKAYEKNGSVEWLFQVYWKDI